MFLCFSPVILATTFKYTVLEYDYYKLLADRQQTITIKNPVSRGSIYSNNTPAGVFATSTDLFDLAVDPQERGNKDRLYSFLADTVFVENCPRGAVEDECIDAILSFTNRPKDEKITYTQEDLKKIIIVNLKEKIEKKYVDSVLLKSKISREETDAIQKL